MSYVPHFQPNAASVATQVPLLKKAQPGISDFESALQSLIDKNATPMQEPSSVPVAAPLPQKPKEQKAESNYSFYRGEEAENAKPVEAQELSILDLVDIINPLQHIPILSGLYRDLTGDTISPVAKVIGGGIFGGPLGLIAATFDASIKQHSGKDVGESLVALLQGEDIVPQGASLASDYANNDGSLSSSVEQLAEIPEQSSPEESRVYLDHLPWLAQSSPAAAMPAVAPAGDAMMRALEKYEMLIKAREKSAADEVLNLAE